ncbi:hypothetical protein KIPB_010406, partial [Kipferlia bialata]
EAEARGLLGPDSETGVTIIVHTGAGAYVCGEETALLNSLEGRTGKPRNKPPYPASQGLYKMPTIVNNVETVSSIPAIVQRGGEWFKSLGVEGSAGSKIMTLSGSINNPCYWEDRMGVNLGEIINEKGQGVKEGEEVLMVLPGGLSTYPIKGCDIGNVTMDYNALEKANTALGTAGMIVLDTSDDLLHFLKRTAHFYWHETCRQCPVCIEGCDDMLSILTALDDGTMPLEEHEAAFDRLVEITHRPHWQTICALADASTDALRGSLDMFRDRLEAEAKARLQ